MAGERAKAEWAAAADGVEAGERLYRMFVRDLVLECSIGAYPQERLKPQPVRINVDLQVREPARPLDDDLANVLSYDRITGAIKARIADGHINLVETLAEEIAAICLSDARVASVKVAVEKLAVEPAAAGIGVEIERRRPWHPAVAELFPLAFPAAVRGGARRNGGS
jgi:dihydroneopterin aldolase